MELDASRNESMQDIDAVLQIIADLTHKSHGMSYIFRGENRPHTRVSSSLYRRYEDIEADGFDIEVVQKEILERAQSYTRYTGETGEDEILSNLQHNGGETNLIDFTTDYLIALFFACDGRPEEPGRIIMIEDSGEGYVVTEPSHPAHRVIAQKSVFVRPNKGYVEPKELVTIDSHLKSPILDYLRNNHGISTESIYNDLHGFILHQRIHQSAYVEFFKGVTSHERGNNLQAIEDFTKAIAFNSQFVNALLGRAATYYALGNYVAAIQDYQSSLALDSESSYVYNNMGNTRARMGSYEAAIQLYDKALDLRADASTYCNRGEARLHLGEWDRAREDFAAATGISPNFNIAGSFRNDYESTSAFEQQTGLTLPEDLTQLLGG